jgi:hypothetical protein
MSNRNSGDVFSPGSSAAIAARPINGLRIAQKRKAGEAFGWNQEQKDPDNELCNQLTVGKSQLSRNAKDIETALATVCKENPNNAAYSFVMFLNKKGREAVRKKIISQLIPSSDDHKIVDFLKAFVDHHAVRGTRQKEVQQAINVMLIACTFTLEDVPVCRFSSLFGVHKNTITKCHDLVKQMITNNQPYQHTPRKERSDCTQEAAALAVNKFCHSEQSSNLDTAAYRFVQVLDANMGKETTPPITRVA